MATLPKMGMGQKIKISPKPHILVFVCIFLSTILFQTPSVVNGTGPGREKFGPQKYQDSQTFKIFQHPPTFQPVGFGPCPKGIWAEISRQNSSAEGACRWSPNGRWSAGGATLSHEKMELWPRVVRRMGLWEMIFYMSTCEFKA